MDGLEIMFWMVSVQPLNMDPNFIIIPVGTMKKSQGDANAARDARRTSVAPSAEPSFVMLLTM